MDKAIINEVKQYNKKINKKRKDIHHQQALVSALRKYPIMNVYPFNLIVKKQNGTPLEYYSFIELCMEYNKSMAEKKGFIKGCLVIIGAEIKFLNKWNKSHKERGDTPMNDKIEELKELKKELIKCGL